MWFRLLCFLAITPCAAAQGAQLSITEELQLPLPAGGRGFGSSCDVWGERAVVSYATTSDRRARVYERAAGAWTVDADLLPSVATNNFAWNVAVAGDVVAVGAPSHGFGGVGAVFLYRRLNGVWTETGILQASDAAPNASFGMAVELDGDRLVVGAPGPAGGVYVFVRTPNGWVEEQKLAAYGTQDGFGSAVAIAGDLVLATARYDDTAGYSDLGSARLFRLGPGGWANEAFLRPVTLAADDMQFGDSCALEDGLAVVGSERSVTNGNSIGAAYVFEPDANGNWFESARLARPGVTWLGGAVALAQRVVVVGANNDWFGGNWATGSVQVFRCAESGWVHDAHIDSSDASPAHRFGLALAAYGETVLIGAAEDPGAGYGIAGACYVYTIARSPVGNSFCGGVANSTGTGAVLAVHGSAVASDDALTAEVIDLPPFQPGYLLAAESFSITNNPGGSQGTLCLGNPLARFTDVVQAADASGRACRDVPLTQVPTTPASVVVTGDTWYFQWWYRDLNPGATSNFSSTVGVAFQ